MASAALVCGCETVPPTISEIDAGPQNAALVACIKTNSQGKRTDGYIMTSVGDQASIKELFEEVMRESTPNTVVGLSLDGWDVVEIHEKDAFPLSRPPSCGPPEKTN
jgi:hypothetical protein